MEAWSIASPDLNTVDFFFWGYVKHRCYASNQKTWEELKQAIWSTMSEINIDSLIRVFNSSKKRLKSCTTSDGVHFENILHQTPYNVLYCRKKSTKVTFILEKLSAIYFF